MNIMVKQKDAAQCDATAHCRSFLEMPGEASEPFPDSLQLWYLYKQISSQATHLVLRA